MFIKLFVITILIAFSSCTMKTQGKDKGGPINISAQLKVDSVGGDTSHEFVLAVETKLSGGSGNLSVSEYEYDFNGDGIIDVATTEASAKFIYHDIGVFRPTVKVIASDLGTKIPSKKAGASLSAKNLTPSDTGTKKEFELPHNVYVTEPIRSYEVTKVAGSMLVGDTVSFKIIAKDKNGKPIPNAAIKLSAESGGIGIVSGHAFDSFKGFIGNWNYVATASTAALEAGTGNDTISDASLSIISDPNGSIVVSRVLPVSLYKNKKLASKIMASASVKQLNTLYTDPDQVNSLELSPNDQFSMTGIGTGQVAHIESNAIQAALPELLTILEQPPTLVTNSASSINTDNPLSVWVTDTYGNPNSSADLNATVEDQRTVTTATQATVTDLGPISNNGVKTYSIKFNSQKAGIVKLKVVSKLDTIISNNPSLASEGVPEEVSEEVQSLVGASSASQFLCWSGNKFGTCSYQEYDKVVGNSFDPKDGSIQILPMDQFGNKFTYEEDKGLLVCWKIKCSYTSGECPAFNPEFSISGKIIKYIDGTEVCTGIDLLSDEKLNGKTELPLSIIKMGTKVGKFKLVPTIGRYSTDGENKIKTFFTLVGQADQAYVLSMVGYSLNTNNTELEKAADLLDGIGAFKLYEGTSVIYNNLSVNSVKTYIVDKYYNIAAGSNFEFKKLGLINADVSAALLICDNGCQDQNADPIPEQYTLLQDTGTVLSIDGSVARSINQHNIKASEEKLLGAVAELTSSESNSAFIPYVATVSETSSSSSGSTVKEHKINSVSLTSFGINNLRFLATGTLNNKKVAVISRVVPLDTTIKLEADPANATSMSITYGTSSSVTLSFTGTTNMQDLTISEDAELFDSATGVAISDSIITVTPPSVPVYAKTASVTVTVTHKADVMSYTAKFKVKATAASDPAVFAELPVTLTINSVCPITAAYGLYIDDTACDLGTMYTDTETASQKCLVTVNRQRGCAGAAYTLSTAIPEQMTFLGSDKGMLLASNYATTAVHSISFSAENVTKWGPKTGYISLGTATEVGKHKDIKITVYKSPARFEFDDTNTQIFSGTLTNFKINHLPGTAPGSISKNDITITNNGTALFIIYSFNGISAASVTAELLSGSIYLQSRNYIPGATYTGTITIPGMLCKTNCSKVLSASPPVPTAEMSYNSSVQEICLKQLTGWYNMGSPQNVKSDPNIPNSYNYPITIDYSSTPGTISFYSVVWFRTAKYNALANKETWDGDENKICKRFSITLNDISSPSTVRLFTEIRDYHENKVTIVNSINSSPSGEVSVVCDKQQCERPAVMDSLHY